MVGNALFIGFFGGLGVFWGELEGFWGWGWALLGLLGPF